MKNSLANSEEQSHVVSHTIQETEQSIIADFYPHAQRTACLHSPTRLCTASNCQLFGPVLFSQNEIDIE